MANDVRIHVTVTDDASPALRKVGQQTDKVGTSASGTGSSMLSMGVAFAAVTTAATVAAGVLYSFYATNRDLELQLRKSTTVFAEQLPVVKAWADSNAAAMGLSSNQATNLAASMADLLIPMGMTRDAATEMATKTIGLAGALSEWSGGQRTAAEAASILQKAFLGETDGLKELGIAISAEQVMAELATKGQENLTGASLEQAKALAIQTLVFAKSTDAQTAYAGGAGTAARAQAELTAQLKTAHEQMSTALAPVIAAVAGALIGVLIPAIDGLVVVFKFLVDHGTAVASALGGIATAIAVLMVPKLILLISTTYAYVAALAAQAVAFAMANPLLAAAAVVAGVAAAAAIALALGTARATVEAEKNKSATDLQTAATNAQADALKKATEAADTHSRALDKMSLSQLAAQFAANEMSGVPDPRVTADLTARAQAAHANESGLKSAADAFLESITGDKARAAAASARTAAGNAAPPAYVTALQDQIRAAYVQGGMKQVEVVRASQANMMAAVDTAAAQMSIDLGITIPDATQLMFDRLLAQQTELAKAQEAIANANMLAQIDAYLKGGQAAVDIVKLQQADTAVEISKMANNISEAFGIKMPEALGMATEAAAGSASAMAEMGKQATSLAVQLFKTTGNTAQQGAFGALAFAVTARDAAANRGDLGALPGLDAAVATALANANAPKMASGGIVRARPGGTMALLGEGGRDEAVIPLGSGGMGGTVNVYLSGVITDPVATGKAVAAALNTASRTTGPLLLSGTVQ